jgi:hypothetical protein
MIFEIWALESLICRIDPTIRSSVTLVCATCGSTTCMQPATSRASSAALCALAFTCAPAVAERCGVSAWSDTPCANCSLVCAIEFAAPDTFCDPSNKSVPTSVSRRNVGTHSMFTSATNSSCLPSRLNATARSSMRKYSSCAAGTPVSVRSSSRSKPSIFWRRFQISAVGEYPSSNRAHGPR